jgi:NADH-ubiquinone oxidoreductase chain 5
MLVEILLTINYMIKLMAVHNQRFFSYLSLFTFFMLILVSGANYFVLFVGQPGLMRYLTISSLKNKINL